MALHMFACMVIIGLVAGADDVKCWNKPCMCCAKGACTTQGDKTFTCNGCISGFTGHNCYEPCQDNCVNCSQTFFINDRICYTCKNGYYNGRREDIADFPLQNDCSLSCQTTCESCTSYYKCTKCKTGYYMSNRNDCYPCADNCAYCLSPTYCQQCKNGFFLNAKDNTCKPCNAYCKTCRSYQTCTQCDDGFYLDGNNCRLCEDPCIVCSGFDKCNECQKGHYLHNGRCSQCSVNCYDCYFKPDSYSTCTVCQNVYYLINGSCNKCDIGCAQCESENNCLKCLSDFKLYDGKCYNCRTPCTACSSDDFCITCQSGYFVYNGQCDVCPEPCIACLSHDQKQSCTGGFYGRNCSLPCPNSCTNDQCITIAGNLDTNPKDSNSSASNLGVAFCVILITAVLVTIILIIYLRRKHPTLQIKCWNDNRASRMIVQYQYLLGLCKIDIVEDVEMPSPEIPETGCNLITEQHVDAERRRNLQLETDETGNQLDGHSQNEEKENESDTSLYIDAPSYSSTSRASAT